MSKYAETGVDATKKGTEVFKDSIENLFPNAFCPISRDPDFPELGQIHHPDGTGSKDIPRYIMFKEGTTDISVFRGSSIDTLGMNTGDVACVGGYPTSFVDYIPINGFYLPKADVLRELNIGFNKGIKYLQANGLDKLRFSGGETADLPYQTKTIDISGTIYGRVKLAEVIAGDKVQSGNVIVGVRSGGKSRHERGENPSEVSSGRNYEINSALMSNGLTLAWHCILSEDYNNRYPETTEAKGKPFYGKYKVGDYVDELGMSVGEALTFPTRMYAPIIVKILGKHRDAVTGLVHNTGGGQTKCLRLGQNVLYIKDNLPEPDPIFKMIQSASGESWEDMHRDYNLGSGLDVIVTDEKSAYDVIGTVERDFGVGAQVVGKVGRSDGKNRLHVIGKFGKFTYHAN